MTSETIDCQSEKSPLYDKNNWLRLVFMLLFALLLHIAAAVMWVLCILQFSFSVLTGQDNENLRYLGNSIAKFVQQALRYLSYNSDKKPFPFGDWPEPNKPQSNLEEL